MEPQMQAIVTALHLICRVQGTTSSSWQHIFRMPHEVIAEIPTVCNGRKQEEGQGRQACPIHARPDMKDLISRLEGYCTWILQTSPDALKKLRAELYATRKTLQKTYGLYLGHREKVRLPVEVDSIVDYLLTNVVSFVVYAIAVVHWLASATLPVICECTTVLSPPID